MMNRLINKFIKCVDKSINIVVMILLLLIIMFSGYALYDSYYVYNGAKLSEDIRRLGADEPDFALSNLQEINPDICGWIKIDDTNIDYPIVIGQDNTEYLDKDYKKKYATSGSIFLDYRNNRDLDDDYSIVYGHNLGSNLMFSNIKKFADREFFETHLSGKLYTSKGNYKIDILYFELVDGFSSEVYGLDRNNNGKNNEIINFFEKKAIRKRNLDITKENKLILLSTCATAGTNDRAVLLGRLTKIDDDEIIDSSLKKIDIQSKEKEKTSHENDTVAPRQTVRVAGRQISTRTILLILLSIIVIIIFIVLLLQKYKRIKRNKTIKKKNKQEFRSKGKHSK